MFAMLDTFVTSEGHAFNLNGRFGGFAFSIGGRHVHGGFTQQFGNQTVLGRTWTGQIVDFVGMKMGSQNDHGGGIGHIVGTDTIDAHATGCRAMCVTMPQQIALQKKENWTLNGHT